MDVLLAGGSGLIGSKLLAQLDLDPKISRIHSFSRSPLKKSSAKVSEHIDEQLALHSLAEDIRPRAAFSCLGTTIKKAGSQAAFQAIDRDLVLSFAMLARKSGCEQFHLVSSMGADAGSRNFYLRTKGQTEAGLADLGFPALHIYRPSLLLGARGEKRSGELLASKIYHSVENLFPSFLDKFRPIEAEAVAEFMKNKLASSADGVLIWENLELHRLK